MTYGEMYERFRETIKKVDVEDYRPDVLMHKQDIAVLTDGVGIRVWFKNGDSILYYPSDVLWKQLELR